ncbi:MAG: peptidogalycan biosysnthesis protein, partial [Planctomycetota bacterium]
MQTRRFGRTELNMPVFSTGGMRYQDGWKDKPLSEVDPDAWNAVANPVGERYDPFLSWEFLETLESTGAATPQTG